MKNALIALLLLGAICFLEFSTLSFPDDALNPATYRYIARAMLQGQLLYRDVFDVKAPGIFAAYGLSHLLWGDDPVSVRIFEGIWQMLTVFLIFQIALLVFQRHFAGWAAVAIYLIHSFDRRNAPIEPDYFVSLPLAAATYAALRAYRKDHAALWLLAGFAVGLTALIKLPCALFGIGLLWAAKRWPQLPPGQFLKRATLLAAGFATPLAGLIFFYALRGEVATLYHGMIVMPLVHVAGHGLWDSPMCSIGFLKLPTVWPLYLLLAILFALAWLCWRREESFALPQCLVVWWGMAATLTVVLHGLFFGYHFVPMFAPLGILIAGMAAEQARTLRMRWLAAAAILLTFAIPLRAELRAANRALAYFRGEREPHPMELLGRSLASQTSADDTVYHWGPSPLVLVAANRWSASRYIHAVWPTLAGPVGDRVRTQLMADLRRRPPKFVVVSKSRAIASGSPCPLERVDHFAGFERFAALQEFLANEYSLESETEKFLFYRKNSAAPAAGAARDILLRMSQGASLSACSGSEASYFASLAR